jgi:hypothetical protein
VTINSVKSSQNLVLLFKNKNKTLKTTLFCIDPS